MTKSEKKVGLKKSDGNSAFFFSSRPMSRARGSASFDPMFDADFGSDFDVENMDSVDMVVSGMFEIQNEKAEIKSERTEKKSRLKINAGRKASDKKNSVREAKKRAPAAVFFVSIIIITLAAMQFLTVFHSYTVSIANLDKVKAQEAELIAKKSELENDIARWDDESYIKSQARKRLGFVFPGEKPVHLNNMPDSQTENSDGQKTGDEKQRLWYEIMGDSFRQADQKEEQ